MVPFPASSAPASPRRYLPALLALVFLSVGIPTNALAQDQPLVAGDGIFELRLGDGSRSVGRILEIRDDQVVFETIAGVRMEVNRAFARLQPARGRIVDGEYWPEDMHTTRLFFAPTGRTLRAGDGYAGLFFILPFVGYGASDDLTLAGGMPLIGSLETVPIWVAPKLRVHHTPNSQISTGIFAIHLPSWDSEYDHATNTYRESSRFIGIAYGVGTFGDLDNAVHLGSGITFGGDETEVPLMVGGEFRVSRRHKILSENWLLPVTGNGAASVGVRFLGDRWTTDLGLMALLGGGSDWDGDEIPYFPIVSFSYAFGGRR
jgi:hypothetical protein